MIDQIQSLLSSLEATYAIEKEVGRGGMGVVYKGIDKRLERPVAIKVLNLGGGGESHQSQQKHSEAVERFRREAKVVARLSHPNIVSIYDVGEAFNQYYMIMEFAEGKPLSSLAGEGRSIPAPVAASVAAQVCSALAFAHESKIIHRDIKPANIVVSPKGVAKLMDFGIAQLHTEGSKLTQAGSMVGSILYTSPEQLNDASAVDERTDIYALGVTLYELLTGQSPYKSESISQLIMEILTTQEDPHALRRINPEIPEILELIVARAMKKNPSERYSTAAEMASDLSRLLQTGQFNASTHFNLSFNDNDNAMGTQSRTSSRQRDSSMMRKTTVNTELVKALKAQREWLPRVVESWKKETLTANGLQQVLSKLIEPALVGPAISCVLRVDQQSYLFVDQGHFVGACHLQTGAQDDSVFATLPENPTAIELFMPDTQQQSVPALLAQIVSDSGLAVQQNLDSGLMDLVPLIENFSSSDETFTGYVVCHANNNLYYYGFEQGQQSLAISAQAEESEAWKDLKALAEQEGVLLDIYQAVPRLVGPSLRQVLSQTQLVASYANPKQTTLQQIVDMGTEEIPIHLIQEAKRNLQLNLQHGQNSNFNSLGQTLDTKQLAENSLHLKFSQWLMREYFYLLNSTGSITSLKYIYTWIPAIEHIAFEEDLQGEDGQKHRFQLVNHGQVQGEKYKKVLALTGFGGGSEAELNRFIDQVINVKKHLIKSGDIGGAFYVSTESFDTEALKLFYARTVEPRKGLLGSLDTLTKYKGFVRIGMNRGFHLNLLEYHKDSQSFEVIAPLLK